MTDKATAAEAKPTSDQEFDSGWGTAADEANDSAAADAAAAKAAATGDAAGAEGGAGGDNKNRRAEGAAEGEAAPEGGSPSDSAADGDKGDGTKAAGADKTPPAGGDPDAGAGGTEADPPEGEQGSEGDGKKFVTLEQFQAAEEAAAKRDRDTQAVLGRIHSELVRSRGGGGGGGKSDLGADKSATQEIELPAKLASQVKKLRDLGEAETADAIEEGYRESIAAQRASMSEFTEKQAEGATASQEAARETARVDALLPGVDWRALVRRDAQGQFVNKEFAEFLAKQPYAAAYEFQITEDPEVLAKMIRSFEDRGKPADGSGKESPPSDKDAGGKQAGQNGNGTQTTQESAEERRRRAQKEAAAGVGTGKQTQTESREDTDDFDVGWRTSASEEAAQKQRDKARVAAF